jgi:outer membrane lipoprotein carrier protein
MRRILLCLLLSFTGFAAAEEPAATNGVESLRRFFTGVQTLSARFTQVVKDDASKTIQESSGNLWIARPDKFRWEYDKPFAQEIVSDGTTLWIYDKELAQVTKRPLSATLGNTPAVLLAGRGRLEDNFSLKPLEARENLQWVQLAPKNKDNGYDNIRIGFELGKLRALEMTDGFGNTTRITLQSIKENPSIGQGRFEYTPPAGVDVVGE